MLRAVFFVALVAASSAATTTTAAATTAAGTTAAGAAVSCQQGAVAAADISAGICSGKAGSYPYCAATAADATNQAKGTASIWNGMTTASQTLVGTTTCAVFGAAPTVTWWTSADRCGAPTCDSTVCGATAGTGTLSTATAAPAKPICCSYYRSLISTACTFSNGTVDTAVTASTSGSALTFGTAVNVIVAEWGSTKTRYSGACAESDCMSSASTATFSALAVLLAALIALVF